MFSIKKLAAKSSATHCTAPNGKGGRHCGRPIRKGRMGDGITCGRELCQLWRSCADDRKQKNTAGDMWES